MPEMVPPCMHNMETKLGGGVLQATVQLFYLPACQPTFQVAELFRGRLQRVILLNFLHMRAHPHLLEIQQ